MFYERIPSTILTSRIDASFYDPIYIEIAKILKRHNTAQLSEVTNFIKKGVFDMPSNLYSDIGIPFLRISDFDGLTVDIENAIKIPKWKHEDEYKTKLIGGDIVISKVGTTGEIAKVPAGYEVNVSQNLIAVSIDHSKIDGDYLLAALKSIHVNMSLERQVTTIVQGKLTLDIIRELDVPLFTLVTQKYIGDKIRQAEQLRAWAMALELKFQKQLKTFYPEAFKDKSTGKKHSMAPIEDMSYTLNPGAFDEERLRIRLYLKKCGAVKLKEVASIEGTTSSDYSKDTTYIGLDSISSGTCALSPSNIRKSGVTGTSRVLNEGVVVAKLRPYLNKISYIPKSLSGSVGSTELLCVRPLNELSGWYIYGVLKSDIGLRQLKPLASGSTHPRIDQYDLYDLIFPIHQDSEIMGKWLENAQAAYFMASYLVISAKTLVEALIEGQLTEEQLIQAQQALDDGDTTLDKAILSKLSNEGYAVEGAAPLFSDIDELYRLLASANSATDSED